MAFARIRSLRNSRRRTPSPAAAPPNPADDPVVNKTPEASNTIAVEETEEYHNTQDEKDAAPIQEIAIDATQEEEAIEWSIPSICTCGLSPSGLLCLTDGLCGIIPPGPPEKAQSTFFLKVPKVDPAENETLQQQQRQLQIQRETVPILKEKKVESLHLQVGPLNKKEANNQAEESESKKYQMPKSSTTERICLPIRAARYKRNIPTANTDEVQTSDDEYKLPGRSLSRASRSHVIQQSQTDRFTRLPIRAGRIHKPQERTSLETTVERSRINFAERRRALIAASKEEEPVITPSPQEESSMNIRLIDISHNASFENDEFETTMSTVSTSEECASMACNKVCKSAMCRGESNTTKGSLDYTTASSHETLEETFETVEETLDYDTDDSTLDFEKGEIKDDRITKAGWITRQLYREGRRDRIDGAQSVELVYTLD